MTGTEEYARQMYQGEGAELPREMDGGTAHRVRYASWRGDRHKGTIALWIDGTTYYFNFLTFWKLLCEAMGIARWAVLERHRLRPEPESAQPSDPVRE